MKKNDKINFLNHEFTVTQVFSYDMSWEICCDEFLDLNLIYEYIKSEKEIDNFYILEAWNKIENNIKTINKKTYLIISNGDGRQAYFCKERREKGFDNSDLWNLDQKILEFLLPRFREFVSGAYWFDENGGNVSGDVIMKDILEGFELMASDKEKTKEDIKKIRKAWRLFEYHFHDLWN